MDELVIAYRNAPKKIKLGRAIMIIGCVLLCVTALADILYFCLAILQEEARVAVFADPLSALQVITLPLLAILLILSAVGGFYYVFDKPGRIRAFASLAAVILLVTFIVDSVVSIRTLVLNLVNPEIKAPQAWLAYLLDLLDIQVSGGLYVIGWFLIRDYTGD